MKRSASKPARKKATAKRTPKPKWVVEYWVGLGTQPYYAHLKCPGNGEVIAPSEGYTTVQARAKTWGPIAKKLECAVVKLSAPPTSRPDDADPTPEFSPSTPITSGSAHTDAPG